MTDSAYTVSERETGQADAMETERIIYFHPAEEMHKNSAAKRHWWQDVVLRERSLTAEETGGFFVPVDCPIPAFYYKKKPWPQEVLSEAMEEVLHRAPGMADAFLHPDIVTCVSEKYAERWEMRVETMESLAACLLAAFAADCLHDKGRVTVLLGSPDDTDRQMEMTLRLLSPYLPRINSLLFYYEEVEGTDIWEETAFWLEEYGYEYGLVPAMRSYLTEAEGLRCGTDRCGGVILDFALQARYPRTEREEQVIYVDLASDREKERSCIRKNGQILYVSPFKYLDTVVKSSYDRKMYATAMSSANTLR